MLAPEGDIRHSHVRSESPELGIWIREDRHKEGFGREAVGLVARWASRTIGIESFTYPVASLNRSAVSS
ncbi:MAG TPA: GNAT family N-acetyltransferase, partial [Trinickia sp.]|nr:GNAT family N-acetyltransferase [Trinickia sp.]